MVSGKCPYSPLDIAATSASYAQMTGLLAGVAFTALVLLLTPTQNQQRKIAYSNETANERIGRSDGKRSRDGPGRHALPLRADSQILLAFFSAFVAFLFTTLAYSILAGDSDPAAAGRIATEELIDGIPFGLAFVTLLHGLAMLLDTANIDTAMIWVARILAAVVLPSIAMFYIVNAVPDTETARASINHGRCPSDVYRFGIELTGVCLLLLVVALFGPILGLWRGRRSTGRAVPISVLVVSIAATAAAGHISSRSPQFSLSVGWLKVFLVVAFVLFTGIGLLLITSWPAESTISVSVTWSRKPRAQHDRRAGTAVPRQSRSPTNHSVAKGGESS